MHCFAFIAFLSETETSSSFSTRQAIEACIHSALPHGRWQLRCGGHHRCLGAVLGGNTTVRKILPLKTWKHGLSGGPQRLFKVDHPKDGHTQEGFGGGDGDSDELLVENYTTKDTHTLQKPGLCIAALLLKQILLRPTLRVRGRCSRHHRQVIGRHGHGVVIDSSTSAAPDGNRSHEVKRTSDTAPLSRSVAR